MGVEIDETKFRRRDFVRFESFLEQDFATLKSWFEEQKFSNITPVAGFELEAWLVNNEGDPAPENESFLQQANDPLIAPELAKFNFELNVDPEPLTGDVFDILHQRMNTVWKACRRHSQNLGLQAVAIGILPTLNDSDLNPANMSKMKRYKALNEQILRIRKGVPIRIDIVGREHLTSTHHDIMLESAATSFQLHMQIPLAQATRAYNAAIVGAAPAVAVATNSPLLFGRLLWEETRIPVFEQAVAVGGINGAAQGPIRRVTFGSGYARHSLLEVFEENMRHYPPLIPCEFPESNHVPYFRLHNGTIWRWNRPLIGFDADGTPHLRIEHRVMSAAPTMIDNIANAAFCYGIQQTLISQSTPPETQLPFSSARDNFYQASRFGLDASLIWLDGERYSAQQLIREKLLPMAYAGLSQLGVDARQSDRYLDIILQRVNSKHTGAFWQRHYIERYGSDLHALLQTYMSLQDSGEPVHTWS